jgi:hypothetical protein
MAQRGRESAGYLESNPMIAKYGMVHDRARTPCRPGRSKKSGRENKRENTGNDRISTTRMSGQVTN